MIKGKAKVTDEQAMDMLKNSLWDNVIEAPCVCCGSWLTCEPDATHSWCDSCGQVVEVLGLCAMGLM